MVEWGRGSRGGGGGGGGHEGKEMGEGGGAGEGNTCTYEREVERVGAGVGGRRRRGGRRGGCEWHKNELRLMGSAEAGGTNAAATTPRSLGM